jgi:hypothetical protein
MRNHDSASLPLLDNRHGRCIEDGFGVDPVGAVKIQGISRMAETFESKGADSTPSRTTQPGEGDQNESRILVTRIIQTEYQTRAAWESQF